MPSASCWPASTREEGPVVKAEKKAPLVPEDPPVKATPTNRQREARDEAIQDEKGRERPARVLDYAETEPDDSWDDRDYLDRPRRASRRRGEQGPSDARGTSVLGIVSLALGTVGFPLS